MVQNKRKSWKEHFPRTIIDWLVVFMNFCHFIFEPRQLSNFRYANTAKEWSNITGQFARWQFWKVYGRYSKRYKYHPLQRFHNAIRKFDADPNLVTQLAQSGNTAFYRFVCGRVGEPSSNFDADLTKLDDLKTINSSAAYLYNELLARKGQESATAAKGCYERGFSRTIAVSDFDDWERFRDEIRSYKRVEGNDDEKCETNTALVALSYKGNTVKITRRMSLLNPDGSPDDKEGLLLQETKQMTADFVDDFRWSQVIRSCEAIAQKEGKSHVRIWIDRFVMMGVDAEERKRLYDLCAWEEFGLLPYAVCPVVRIYDKEEMHFGTDFWRKLETVLGVAGRGLVVDDYMLRKWDDGFWYEPSVYTRLKEGLSCLGGTGIFVRSTTLAMATAIVTDGVSVSGANEDMRTLSAVNKWKAWALRTIAEGAYSKEHAVMMSQEEPFAVGMKEFHTIAFWESLVSRCSSLTGRSYLDMSYQKSNEWRKCSSWDGVTEWIGMMPSSCLIEDRERENIMGFLTRQTKVSTYITTTGHIASQMMLTGVDGLDKRMLVVNFSRGFAVSKRYVTAVAEATGLWRKRIMPWSIRDIVDPNGDQKATIEHDVRNGDSALIFEYRPMKSFYSLQYWGFVVGMIALAIYGLVLSRGIALVGFPIVVFAFLYKKWPWRDDSDIGEALFDNLLMDGLFGAGIKTYYRKLKTVPYTELNWV